MLIKSTFRFGLIKMTYLPRPCLRKLKCFIIFISLRTHGCAVAWAKVKEALPFAERSIKCQDDEVLSVGIPTVGKSPPFYAPDFSLLWRWFKADTALRLRDFQLHGPNIERLSLKKTYTPPIPTCSYMTRIGRNVHFLPLSHS